MRVLICFNVISEDMELFQLCYFDDFARNVVNKRMELARKEVATINNVQDSIYNEIKYRFTLIGVRFIS